MDRVVLRLVAAMVGEVGFRFGYGIVGIDVVVGSFETSDRRCMIVVAGCRAQMATGGG